MTTLLTAAELDSMRDEAVLAMGGTAVITYAGTLVSDGGGGFTGGTTTAGTFPCRVAPVNQSEREIGSRIAAEAQVTITLPAGTPVEPDSHIVCSGGTYEVVGLRERDPYEITRRVEARRLR